MLFEKMAEPPPKRLRLAELEDEDEDEASELLSNDAESDISTEATFGEEFEMVDLSGSEGEYIYLSSPEQAESDVSQLGSWWASGPPGEFQFLMLVEPALEIELANYGLSSGECLPCGWVLDEGILQEFARDNERGD